MNKLKIVSVANRLRFVSTCDETVFQRVLENTGLKSEHKQMCKPNTALLEYNNHWSSSN